MTTINAPASKDGSTRLPVGAVTFSPDWPPPKLINETFPTGAVRDSPKGKGLFTHVPFEAVRRLALVLEEGAERYEPRNWEKGMPVERCLDSALRHVYKYLDGHKDEDHLGMAFWNLMAAVTIEERAESGRLPKELLLESRADYVRGN